MNENEVIKPTVGRVVWFYRYEYKPEEQPLAAIVAYVWGDRQVNLCVFDQNGVSLCKTRVKLVQPGDEIPSGGNYCAWMPYQIGQHRAHQQPPAQAK